MLLVLLVLTSDIYNHWQQSSAASADWNYNPSKYYDHINRLFTGTSTKWIIGTVLLCSNQSQVNLEMVPAQLCSHTTNTDSVFITPRALHSYAEEYMRSV